MFDKVTMMMDHSPSLPVPTSTSSVGPIPTVIPGYDPIFQEVHSVGRRTLWLVLHAFHTGIRRWGN